MAKKILITGAGSGFGEGAAIGLAKSGYDVIAGVHIWPQLTKMREQAKSLGLTNLRVEKLDIGDPFDVAAALKWDIDILVNNAAISVAGPLSEIPLELVYEVFETNVFAGLNLAQKFACRWINEKRSGKIVFTSSVAGLIPVAGFGAYVASKYALEAIAQVLQEELKSHSIQVQTINPGAYKTGFNDAMVEAAYHWMDDEKDFIKKAEFEKQVAPILANQRDPQEVIEAMISIIPSSSGTFRNLIPKDQEESLKKKQEEVWEKKI